MMRKILVLGMLLMFACGSLCSAFGKAGKEIPLHVIEPCKAIESAQKFFLELAKNDAGLNKVKERYIVTSAIYSNVFTLTEGRSKQLPGWSWLVTLVDRVQNDHSYVILVEEKGCSVLIYSL